MKEKQSRYNLFRILLLAGFLLGVALLVQTASTYSYVYRNLIIGAAQREADNRNQSLQVVLRGVQDRATAEAATETIEELLESWNREQVQVAWIRIIDQKNESLSYAGSPEPTPDLWSRVGRPAEERHNAPILQSTESGQALVEIYGITAGPRGGFGGGGRRGGPTGAGGTNEGNPRGRGPGTPGSGGGLLPSFGGFGPPRGGPVDVPGGPQRSGAERGPDFGRGTPPPPPTRGGPDSAGRGPQPPRAGAIPRGGARGQQKPAAALEIAIPLTSVSGPFASLRRTLVVGVGTSLALMASLILIALRLPHHLRGQQIDAQLESARRVQTDLLAPPYTVSPQIDFALECIPAGEVGGDFCDVFSVGNGRVALVLGDVSGKGISAALLMGLIHGAIHSVPWTESATAHESASRHLNELLCKKTARERFSSLFWAYFDPRESMLHYVNAGHLPPLFIRKRTGGDTDFEVKRLDVGGTVLGLLPGVAFQQGHVSIQEGDLLVVFSDGFSEAINTKEEEFGEARMLAAIRECWDKSAEEIRDTAIARVQAFIDNAPPNDDQTLIVARFQRLAVGENERRTAEREGIAV